MFIAEVSKIIPGSDPEYLYGVEVTPEIALALSSTPAKPLPFYRKGVREEVIIRVKYEERGEQNEG